MQTVLASTLDHVVEFESGVLSIHRRCDGFHLALKGAGIAGTFRGCLATHTAERVIQSFIRMAGPSPTWNPSPFKAGVLESL